MGFNSGFKGLKLAYVLPSATINFISFVNTCYMFLSYWLSSGI